MPLAVIVKTSAPFPPLTSTVSLPSPPSMRSVPSPGFQIMRSLPASPNIWSLPVPPISVSLPSPPNNRSLPALPISVSLPAPPNSWSLPEPPINVSLPEPPNSLAAGSAPLVSSSEIVSLPPVPNTWMKEVLATVAGPPVTVTAPPLTKIVPAASRLTTIVLLRLSSNTDRMPEPGEKLALIAMVVVLSKGSRAEEARRGALARGQVLSRQTDDRLEGVLQTILFFCGDALKIS